MVKEGREQAQIGVVVVRHEGVGLAPHRALIGHDGRIAWAGGEAPVFPPQKSGYVGLKADLLRRPRWVNPLGSELREDRSLAPTDGGWVIRDHPGERDSSRPCRYCQKALRVLW